MHYAFYILAFLLAILHLFPLTRNPHWFFRLGEFAKVQVFLLQILWLALSFLIPQTPLLFALKWAMFLMILHNGVILIKYTPLYPKPKNPQKKSDHPGVKVLSVNVYQFNNNHQKLLDLIQKVKPDIVLTMESDSQWDGSLQNLQKEYPESLRIPLDNTYGMHFFTRLPVKQMEVKYWVSHDIPSIKVQLIAPDQREFIFYGVHPPPPTPTEESNSLERDGELLAVAKNVQKQDLPVVVMGDFNNVAWARSSTLFRKAAQLVDPRIGRGMVSTFHAKYPWFRIPIDLMFHSVDVGIESLKTLTNINSDHLPVFAHFYLTQDKMSQQELLETLEEEEKKEVKEMIQSGKEENGNRPPKAVE